MNVVVVVVGGGGVVIFNKGIINMILAPRISYEMNCGELALILNIYTWDFIIKCHKWVSTS